MSPRQVFKTMEHHPIMIRERECVCIYLARPLLSLLNQILFQLFTLWRHTDWIKTPHTEIIEESYDKCKSYVLPCL